MNTVENICYEYAEVVIFSQDVSFNGDPVLIIADVESKYVKELSKFLSNHNYKVSQRKKINEKFSLIRFELVHSSKYDKFFKNKNKDIGE